MKFIVDERLKWTDLQPSGAPFSNPNDIKVLFNDWPYGVDGRIVHLVIWSKFELEDDPETELLTVEAKSQVDAFVEKTFCSRMKPGHVSGLIYRCLASQHVDLSRSNGSRIGRA